MSLKNSLMIRRALTGKNNLTGEKGSRQVCVLGFGVDRGKHQRERIQGRRMEKSPHQALRNVV